MEGDRVRELHPCFGARANKGRIHLPVCPACNIECAFCSRKLNDYENRPGVAAAIITPAEAEDYVEKALAVCPEITVVGIAGPGDPLVSNRALETFTRIKKRFPQLLRCMSTNGLLLSEKADQLIALGIDALTVTVNAVDPQIQAQINGGISYHGRRYEGGEAARILIENQLAGIRRLAQAGVTIKVNTVLIMEINRDHIAKIARTVSAAGAQRYNIIPLIPQARLAHCKVPSCAEIESARREAQDYIEVFRHCQQCRADAVGVPGKSEFSGLVYANRLEEKQTFSHG